MQRLAIGSFLGVVMLLLAFTASIARTSGQLSGTSPSSLTQKLPVTGAVVSSVNTSSAQAVPHLYKPGCRP